MNNERITLTMKEQRMNDILVDYMEFKVSHIKTKINLLVKVILIILKRK